MPPAGIAPSQTGYPCAIATFSTRLIATDRIHAPFDDVWGIFADTATLVSLTPLLAEVRDLGERWEWRMAAINRLGISAAPVFTTLMDVHATGMRFRPDPTRGEPAAAAGEIRVEPEGLARTSVSLDLTASVSLPLPRLARRAVEGVMDATLRAGGRRFLSNLLQALDNPADDGLRIRRMPVAASGSAV